MPDFVKLTQGNNGTEFQLHSDLHVHTERGGCGRREGACLDPDGTRHKMCVRADAVTLPFYFMVPNGDRLDAVKIDAIELVSP